MRYIFVILILAIGVFCGFGCEPKSSPTSGKPTTGSRLLLLDNESDAVGGEFDGVGADNRRCLVCHMNFAKEKIAVKHARAGIGCNQCHGESDEHIADESWAMGGKGTAPEIMFSRSDIVGACMKCHPKEKIGKVARHKVVLSGTGDKVCTDCHDKHRMADRRFQWK